MCAVPSALSGLASGFGMGTGRFPDAFTTAKSLGVVIQFEELLWSTSCSHVYHRVVGCCGREQTVIVCWCLLCYSPWHPTQWCVGCWVSDWCISTSQLRTLLCFHIWPINPVVYWTPQGKSHLEAGFPLRCFQRLSFPNVANQPCTWRYNWHTRGSSVPVLSY